MSLPLSMVVHLHIKLSQKIALCCIFTLALFIVALDTARFVFVLTNSTSLDNVLLWNMLECAVVIVVANAPVLRPLLFKRDFMRGGGSLRGGGFLARVWKGHRRAQSTPWSSSTTGDGRQYGHNRLSAKSAMGGDTWRISQVEDESVTTV
jgi:hypothetical protein